MREFLWERVYDNPTVHDEFIKCHMMLHQLFQLLSDRPDVFKRVTGKTQPKTRAVKERAICDFMAGMTDRYAMRLFESLFVPLPWPVDLMV